MKRLLVLFLIAVLISGCSSVPLLQAATPTPTITPTQTLTPTNTPTLTPTITVTPDFITIHRSTLPEKPSGFEWKEVPELNLIVLIPDGWYFKNETRKELGLEGFYVTKENIDETGRFSTGLTVFIYRDFNTQDESESFARTLLINISQLPTTKDIIGGWDYKTNSAVFHHLRVEGEFPYETEINKNKISHYISLAQDNVVYLVIFESPKATWETTFIDIGQVILDRLVLAQ
jgi:hypothetical protein